MTTERKRAFIISWLYTLLLVALLYVGIKYLLGLFWPFLAGFAIAVTLRPPVEFLERKVGKRGKFWSGAVLLAAYGLAGGLLVFACWKGGSELAELVRSLPEVYAGSIGPALDQSVRWLAEFAGRFSPALYEQIMSLTQSTAQTLGTLLTSFSGNVAAFLAGLAAKIPSVVVGFAFTVISSVFFSLDYERVTRFLKRQMPRRYCRLLTQLKSYLAGAFARMTRAYLILMGITFLELLTGLFLLGAEYPVTVAAVAAVVDVLPVFGTGIILLPWAAVEFLRGQYFLALGLLLLYGVVAVVRNFLEPKIVGKQTGLHPLATLAAFYIGARLFGFAGLFLPVALILLKDLRDAGVVRLWKD